MSRALRRNGKAIAARNVMKGLGKLSAKDLNKLLGQAVVGDRPVENKEESKEDGKKNEQPT